MDQEFLNTLVRVLSMRKDAVVVCAVKSETGLELFMNTADMVLQLGTLDVARLEVIDRHAQFRDMHEAEIRKAEGIAMAALTDKPGQAN